MITQTFLPYYISLNSIKYSIVSWAFMIDGMVVAVVVAVVYWKNDEGKCWFEAIKFHSINWKIFLPRNWYSNVEMMNFRITLLFHLMSCKFVVQSIVMQWNDSQSRKNKSYKHMTLLNWQYTFEKVKSSQSFRCYRSHLRIIVSEVSRWHVLRVFST